MSSKFRILKTGSTEAARPGGHGAENKVAAHAGHGPTTIIKEIQCEGLRTCGGN